MNATVAQAASPWQSWDGRRLRWDAGALRGSALVELCIDDIVFERFAAGSRGEADFAQSPSGCAEMEFSLRAADGGALGPPWRILHGRAAAAGVDAWTGPVRRMRLPPAATREPDGPPAAAASIVVPIYNSPQCVERCIASVLRWTQGPARLILIDDASDDPGVADVLARHATRPGVVVHRNARNLGYTRSCNIGIELAGADDVVLLNSDTEVGPRWLNALRQVAYGDASVGTATAVSDNAGAFSVPEIEQYCPIPARWNLVMAQRVLLQRAGGWWPELPTGNGFCMFVRRMLFERVGMLDADAFPAGYGEENDLCQRAERAGLRHVIAGNVLVRHVRSASFGEARRLELGARGMAVLRQRYPDYEAKVGATLFGFARRALDYRVRRLYAGRDGFHTARPPRPRLLLDEGKASLAPELASRHECFALERSSSACALRSLESGEIVDEGPAEVATFRAWLVRHGFESAAAELGGIFASMLQAACGDVHLAFADATGADAAELAKRCRTAQAAVNSFGIDAAGDEP